MTRTTIRPGGGTATGRRGPGSTSLDFETAQRSLFEEIGLDATSRFVDLEAPRVRTHVFEAGPVNDDPPLVFVHGGTLFGAFFAPLMVQFDDTRTIGFDRPGYGLSGPFVYTRENVRQTGVDVLGGLLDELGLEQVDLVGHSGGGYASILFALAHPERVRRLVLIGSVPTFPGTRPPLPLRLMIAPLLGRLLRQLQKPGEEGILDLAEMMGEREPIQRYPALIRAMAAHEGNPESSGAGLSEFESHFSVFGWHRTVSVREHELRAIEQPTLVIWGDDDPLGGPDDIREGVDSIAHSRLETTATGHVPFFAYPERCARLIQETRDQSTTDVE